MQGRPLVCKPFVPPLLVLALDNCSTKIKIKILIVDREYVVFSFFTFESRVQDRVIVIESLVFLYYATR